MAYQVIQQPGGELAIFSTYTDTIVMWDATPEDVTQWFVDRAVADTKRHVAQVLEAVSGCEPSKVYHQFAMTWDEALEMDREHHGEAHLAVTCDDTA